MARSFNVASHFFIISRLFFVNKHVMFFINNLYQKNILNKCIAYLEYFYVDKSYN